jgi:hypothetical protein
MLGDMRRLLFLLPFVILLAGPAGAQLVVEKKAAPAPRSASVARAVEQCRTGCAQRYYFCLAEAEPETCSPVWAQCRARCASGLPR